jgi:hypothetical protein
MCLLSYYPPDVVPDEAELLLGAKVNDEGYGMGIRTSDGHLIVSHALADAPGLIAFFCDLRKAFPDSHAVFHSRLSTGSAISLLNTHPIRVPVDSDTVIFHNGSLPIEPHLLEASGMSDTRYFAKYLWPRNLDEDHGALEHWAGPRNKIVILTRNPCYAQPAYVINARQFITTPAGAKHSNADFLGKGVGWDEMTINGDLFRYRISQPGQCGNCAAFGHDGAACTEPRSKTPIAWRNETKRRAMVAAAK